MDAKTLRTQIYGAALPMLRGRTVTDLAVGISLLAVELDHREISVAYVIREDLGGGCSIFPYGTEAVGRPAEEIGEWLISGTDDLQRAIGCAVINAAGQVQKLEDRDSREHPFDLTLSEKDTVGIIGFMPPVIERLRPTGCRIVSFDRGKSAGGDAPRGIAPTEQQAVLLPACDAVIMTGTAVVNGTAPELFGYCARARDVLLLGASVPLIPAGYRNTPVTVLAGGWWDHGDRDTLFGLVVHAAGMRKAARFMIRKSVRIR